MSMKKTFDTESMYKKIMPSGNSQASSEIKASDSEPESSAKISAEKKEVQIVVEDMSIPQNIMVYIVRDKMNMVMEKMECCKCEKCKADIFTRVLNQLTPKYKSGTKEEIEEEAEKFDSAAGLEVTTIVLHEVLELRKNPHH